MELDGIDRALGRLRASMEAMSANLVELESDPDRVRLDHASLAGATATRWSPASHSVSCLWQWFSQLNDLLERASQLRGTKTKLDADRRNELERLVVGPSIELATADVPLAERGLLGPSVTMVHCTPDDLLGRMVTAFDQAQSVITACAQVWRDLEPRLSSLAERRAAADKLAAGLGEQHRPELVRLGQELDAMAQAVATDPLSADRRGIDPLEATLSALEGDLRGLVSLRDGLGQRLSDARAQLEELRHVIAAGADANREVTEKIAAPVVPEPLVADQELERMLDRATAAAGSAQWRAARQLLDQWAARAASQLAEAQRVVDANRAPIAARNELRGRLDAYRAKAYRSGLLEDRAVSELYGRAHEALYTAPTDLVAAADMVLRYQQALAGPRPRGVHS